MLKRLLIAIAMTAFALSAHGQGRIPSAGVDYLDVSPPQPTETGNRIEVVEFFWYRCPYCYMLEPPLEAWLKKLPADAQFRRVPAVFNDEWALDARIFFALEATGHLERLHRPLFDAIHKEGGVRLKGQSYLKWVADWLAKQGVDMSKYDAALRSFTVDSKLKRAYQTAQAFKIDGVPAIAVQGRYLVSASMTGEPRAMIGVTEFLMNQARKTLPRGKSAAKK